MKRPNLYLITIQHFEGFITKINAVAETTEEASDKVIEKVGLNYKIIEVVAVQENIIL